MRGSLSAAIVEPYASALMATAQAHSCTEKFGEDMAFLLELLSSSDELQQLLANPLVKPEPKKAVLQRLVEREVHPYILNFLLLLVDRRRILFLAEICRQFQELLRKLNQTVLAEITSAVQLTSDQERDLERKVLEITGARRVELATQVNPELIGGFIVKVGSRVVDASLRGQLRRLGLQLSASTA
jgi:F-type H+-transporting ATPase subunit delta